MVVHSGQRALRLPVRVGVGMCPCLEHGRAIRAAVDRVHAKNDTLLDGAREVALFPMMTGG